MRQLRFDEAVLVALYERSRRFNTKLKSDIEQKAKEVIERHNLSDKEIERLFDWFTGKELIHND